MGRRRGVLRACHIPLLLFACGAMAPAEAQPQEHSFNIPAQGAITALQAFAQQSGKQVLFPYDAVAARGTPALIGRYSDAEALKRLASAAGLVVSSNDGSTVTLRAKVTAPIVPPPGGDKRGSRETASDDVVITAQRREERSFTVPISVTAITGSQLERAGVVGTRDLTVVTPGLNAAMQGAFFQPAIRGVT